MPLGGILESCIFFLTMIMHVLYSIIGLEHCSAALANRLKRSEEGVMKQSACVEDLRGVARTVSSFFLVLSLIILSLSVAGVAQQLTATLTGSVTDASGAVVPNATVVVHSDETGTDVRSVTASSTGDFNITTAVAAAPRAAIRSRSRAKVSRPTWPAASSSTWPRSTLSTCN